MREFALRYFAEYLVKAPLACTNERTFRGEHAGASASTAMLLPATPWIHAIFVRTAGQPVTWSPSTGPMRRRPVVERRLRVDHEQIALMKKPPGG